MPKTKKLPRYDNEIDPDEVFGDMVYGDRHNPSIEQLSLLTLKELVAIEKAGNEHMADVKDAQLRLMKVIRRVKKKS